MYRVRNCVRRTSVIHTRTLKLARLTDRCEVRFENGATHESEVAEFADSRNHESVPALRRVPRDDRGVRRVGAQRLDEVECDNSQMLPIRRGVATTGRRQAATLRADVERMEAFDLLADEERFRQDVAHRMVYPRWPKTGMRRSFEAELHALPEIEPVYPVR